MWLASLLGFVLITSPMDTPTTPAQSPYEAGMRCCVMDATVPSGVSGWYVVPSSTIAGECHVQAFKPTHENTIGYMYDESTVVNRPAKIIVQWLSAATDAVSVGIGAIPEKLPVLTGCQ